MEVDMESTEEIRKKRLGERIEYAGWALFLIMLGVLWMLPEEAMVEGGWLIGSGLIILGVQIIRGLRGLRFSGSTMILGVLALGLGFGDMFSFDLPVFPALLVLVGLYMIFEIIAKRRG